MHLKLRLPTGAGKEALLLYIRHYRSVAVICSPILKPQYEEFAARMRREYQIKMPIFDRTDYYHETIQDAIRNKEIEIDAILIDDYADALAREFGSHPKVPMIVNMQEYFYTQKIVMIVLE